MKNKTKLNPPKPEVEKELKKNTPYKTTVRVAVIHKPIHQVVLGTLILLAAAAFAALSIMRYSNNRVTISIDANALKFLIIIVFPLTLLGTSFVIHSRHALKKIIYKLLRYGLSVDEIKETLTRAGFDEIKLNETIPKVELLMTSTDQFHYGAFFYEPVTKTEKKMIMMRTFTAFATFVFVTVLFVLLLLNKIKIVKSMQNMLDLFNIAVFFLIILYLATTEYQHGMFYQSKLEKALTRLPYILITLTFLVALPIFYAFL